MASGRDGAGATVPSLVSLPSASSFALPTTAMAMARRGGGGREFPLAQWSGNSLP